MTEPPRCLHNTLESDFFAKDKLIYVIWGWILSFIPHWIPERFCYYHLTCLCCLKFGKAYCCLRIYSNLGTERQNLLDSQVSESGKPQRCPALGMGWIVLWAWRQLIVNMATVFIIEPVMKIWKFLSIQKSLRTSQDLRDVSCRDSECVVINSGWHRFWHIWLLAKFSI